MSERVPRIVGSMCLAALMLGACGGDGLTREEFIARANRICSSANDELTALGRPQDMKELQEFAATARRVNARMLRQLDALEPPEEDREKIDRMLDRLRDATDLIPEFSQAARAEDTQGLQQISEKIRIATAEASKIAADYGLEECAEGSGVG